MDDRPYERAEADLRKGYSLGLEVGMKSGAEIGYEEGYSKGYDDGYKDAKKGIAIIIKELEFAVRHNDGVEKDCYQRALNLVKQKVKVRL